jgi:hypothetical protein
MGCIAGFVVPDILMGCIVWFVTPDILMGCIVGFVAPDILMGCIAGFVVPDILKAPSSSKQEFTKPKTRHVSQDQNLLKCHCENLTSCNCVVAHTQYSY